MVYQQKKDDIFSALMRTHKIAFGTLFIGGVGIEDLRRIKEKHPKTEVILLTGQASTADGVEGIKSGAFDYLSNLLINIRLAKGQALLRESRKGGRKPF